MLKLDGAYEPSYIGPRVEITGDLITVLWRSAPALSTRFTTIENGERVLLRLEDNALRNTPDSEPYATVKEIYFENDTLTVVNDYPISGESTEEMKRTDKSRFGDVNFATKELLPQVFGKWKCESFHAELSFAGDILQGMTKTRIVGLRYNYENGDRIYIKDADPARDRIDCFYNLYLEGGRLFATIDVSDAPSLTLEFAKMN
ncbi:MAG: hypothetical protein J6O40_00625 [Ruminococcus sp.]|nr:hypothetical protein [Ruminococcus sp.]